MKKMMIMLQLSLIFIMSSATVTKAYFVDDIKAETVGLKTAALGFGKEENILADTSELDDRLLPLAEGDSFKIRFSAVCESDTAVYAVPRLIVNAENFEEGDVILVTDGTKEIYMFESEGKLYSECELKQPGEIVEKEYTIKIVKHSAQEPLIFSYEYTIAAVQSKNNEGIDEKHSEEELYENIVGRKDVNGFSSVSDPAMTEDINGNPADKKYYSVRIEPDIKEGNSTENIYRWYAKKSNENENILFDNKNLGLILNINNVSDGLFIRYEVENEAGYISSERFVFNIRDGELECRKENGSELQDTE